MSKPFGWREIVILPDYQIPYHDKTVVGLLTRFVAEFQPDQLVHVGDFMDFPTTARWNKGYAMEYAPTLNAELTAGIKVLNEIRNVYTGPFSIKMGNHDERCETYVRQYAPAFEGFPGISYESMLELDSLEISAERRPFDVAPGWVVAHGHERPVRSGAGGTHALGIAKGMGKSVVCGHTHRRGLVANSVGYNGKVSTINGLEVGHAMDMRGAHYLKTGGADWQQAFAILRVKGTTVLPELVPIERGTFVVNGVQYGGR